MVGLIRSLIVAIATISEKAKRLYLQGEVILMRIESIVLKLSHQRSLAKALGFRRYVMILNSQTTQKKRLSKYGRLREK